MGQASNKGDWASIMETSTNIINLAPFRLKVAKSQKTVKLVNPVLLVSFLLEFSSADPKIASSQGYNEHRQI